MIRWMRYEFLCARESASLRRLFICQSVERGWLVRQSAQHRDTKDSDVVCDKKEKAVSALACGNGGSRREERKKERAKTARKRQNGGCQWSDGDSENARAKGYEMKFSSHPFCVSEGIPVRQEVPSRNRRKRKKPRLEEEKERKDEIGEEGEEEKRWVEMAVERCREGLRDIGRGEVFMAGRSVARKLSAQLRLYRRSQREGTPSTWKSPDIW